MYIKTGRNQRGMDCSFFSEPARMYLSKGVLAPSLPLSSCSIMQIFLSEERLLKLQCVLPFLASGHPFAFESV